MSDTTIPLPRHDFYQTAEHVIVALYLKGLNAPSVQEHVEMQYQPNQVVMLRPNPTSDAATEGEQRQRIELGPLFGAIRPEGSSARFLSTKVELKLIKSEPIHWPTLLSSIAASQPSIPGSSASPRPTQTQPATQSGPSEPSSSSQPQAAPVSDQAALDDIIGIAQPRSAHTGGPGKINAQRKNWDKLVDAELQEKEDSGDPNAGGDAALQKMFAQIYAGADPDTKRAMIKSFTESGGTTLSTDWADVSKGKVPTRPPDGMEARKY